MDFYPGFESNIRLRKNIAKGIFIIILNKRYTLYLGCCLFINIFYAESNESICCTHVQQI